MNGEVRLHDSKLRLNDVVMPAERPQPRVRKSSAGCDLPQILLETADALVVSKPAGLSIASRGSGSEPVTCDALQRLRPNDDLRIVHKLDRNASGCWILAKGASSARHLETEFAGLRVKRSYIALVSGVPNWAEQDIDDLLGPDRRRPGMILASAEPRPGFREAHTNVLVRERYGRHSLLELHPTTDCSHQIRVHLKSIGHPIVSDDGYGGERLLLSRLKADYKKRTGVEERPLLRRMFLHVERVEFFDVDGNEVVAVAPIPEDLGVALRHVEKHRSMRRT